MSGRTCDWHELLLCLKLSAEPPDLLHVTDVLQPVEEKKPKYKVRPPLSLESKFLKEQVRGRGVREGDQV
jgi:hypothetical protein